MIALYKPKINQQYNNANKLVYKVNKMDQHVNKLRPICYANRTNNFNCANKLVCKHEQQHHTSNKILDKEHTGSHHKQNILTHEQIYIDIEEVSIKSIFRKEKIKVSITKNIKETARKKKKREIKTKKLKGKRKNELMKK